MEYREIGKTGMKASVIGLGPEHIDHKPYELVKETVDAALDAGMNIMDLFMPGDEVREYIGRALGGRRDKVLLQGHIGSVDKDGQYDVTRDLGRCQAAFEALLKNLNTDYIDFGMLFFMDSENAYNAVFETGIIDYVLKLKQKGIIRGIGASSHNPVIASKMVETGLLDVLLFSINPAFDMTPVEQDVLDNLNGDFSKVGLVGPDPKRAELYRLCQQKDVGITVMKTFGGGKLLTAEHSPFGRALSVGQCIHYALARPAVVSALVGCQGAQQVQQAMNYFNLSDAERDYTDVITEFAKGAKPSCMYCNHCLPCPSEIDIAAVTKYLDIAALDEQNISPGVASHYRSLAHHASECVGCKSCEKKCPFDVPIIENMARAARLFGK